MHAPSLLVRTVRPGEEAALRAIYAAAVHTLAQPYYTPAQRAAWAPEVYDAAAWAERIRRNQPFVAEVDGAIDGFAGFADLQPSGYIDLFFVAPAHARRGVATALMARIHQAAAQAGMPRLHAQVSLAAEAFFVRQGFVVEARQQVEVRGAVLANARMQKWLVGEGAVLPNQ